MHARYKPIEFVLCHIQHSLAAAALALSRSLSARLCRLLSGVSPPQRGAAVNSFGNCPLKRSLAGTALSYICRYM